MFTQGILSSVYNFVCKGLIASATPQEDPHVRRSYSQMFVFTIHVGFISLKNLVIFTLSP